MECETNINGHLVFCLMLSRGLLKRQCHHEEPDQRKLILLNSANPFQHSGLDASQTPVESLWDQFCPVPQTEAVFRGENFMPAPPPLRWIAPLFCIFCFLFHLNISMGLLSKWAIPKRPGYVKKFLSVFSGQLRTLRCLPLPQKYMDLVHNDFCNDQMAPGLVGRILKLHHSFPPWRFQSKNTFLSDDMMNFKLFIANFTH